MEFEEITKQIIGSAYFVTDVIVADTVVVELKSVARIVKAHEIQLVNYLAATRKPVGLILNFSPTKVEVKRKVRVLQNQQED